MRLDLDDRDLRQDHEQAVVLQLLHEQACASEQKLGYAALSRLQHLFLARLTKWQRMDDDNKFGRGGANLVHSMGETDVYSFASFLGALHVRKRLNRAP